MILGRRVKTRAGEIDIIAVRGKRLAFVEVKRRLTLRGRRGRGLGAAGGPHPPRVPISGSRAARAITSTILAFDVILLVPRPLPRHIPDGM